jgi:DNA polymerase/3'-5' exonuclease PolX
MKFSSVIDFLEKEKNLQIRRKPSVARFIQTAYFNVIGKIKQTYRSNEVVTKKKISRLPITIHMKEKIYEFIESKKDEKVEELPRDEENKLLDELTTYLGMGQKKAKELIAEGLKNIGDLRKKKWFSRLPLETQMMLKYKPKRSIPHEYMEELEPYLTRFKERKSEVILVGSFRRKTRYSRDFDIMIVSDSKEILDLYLEYVRKLFDGEVYIYSKGRDKMSLIIDVSKFIKVQPRIKLKYKFDIFRTPKKEKYAMLLYSTGSKGFNITMRRKAKKKGFLLNQTGLYDSSTGERIHVKNEKDFFKKIGMKYVIPEQRY